MITSRDTRLEQLEKLNHNLTEKLKEIPISKEVDACFDNFHDLLQSELNESCPIVTRSINRKKFRREPWLTAGLLISMDKQKKLYQNSLKNWQQLMQLKNIKHIVTY